MWSTALLLVSLTAASTATPYVGGFAADHSYSYRGGSAAQGAYTFVDASGQEPVRETPEVARARQQHLEAVAEAVARQRTLHGAPVPHSVHTARAPQPVADTPEVAAARAHHLAIVQDAHARAGGVVVSVTPTPLPAVAAWSTPYAVASTPAPHAWGVSSSPAPVQDTVEVAAAKAKHLAAVEEAKARVAAASSGSSSTFHQAYSAGSSSSFGHQTAYSALGAAPLPVHDTVEVAAARAQHLSAVAEAASRVSIASQYAAPAVHAARLPAPAPAPAPIAAPAWHARPASVAVRFNTIASVDDASGRYIPDDEGQYDPRLDAEGQYDPRYDAEGQYDPRLNAEGQYVPSLHDEGQWVPSANEGQYVQGRDGSDGEDNMPYSYSYSDGLSSKTETKTADGITRGRFSYVDANGVLQAVNYEADNYNGFRASGTNLPQPPSAIAAAAAPVVASARVYHPPGPAFPAPVEAFRAPVAAYAVPAAYGPVAGAVPDVPADTPEVAAAKAAHFAAHREAGARLSNAYGG